MKKLLFILLLFIPFCSFTQESKIAGCYVRMIEPKSEKYIYENDSIKFRFYPSDYFWKVSIENKTNSSIKCDWNNVLFIMNKKSSKVIFDDTVLLFKDKEKEISTIADGTILLKSILPVVQISSDDEIYPVILKRKIKKLGNQEIRIIIPIEYGNTTKTYEFKFIISLE